MKTARAIAITQELSSTRYHLLVVEDPEGGLIVTWPDARWAAWAANYEDGEIRSWGPRTRTRGPSAIDLKNIGTILNVVRSHFYQGGR